MKICFIGGGNMASALIGGLLAKGHATRSLSVAEPNEETRERLASRFGVACGAAFENAADVIVFAVKPQNLQEAASALGAPGPGQLVISVVAGIRLADLCRWLGGHRRLVRAMPNMAALAGQGIAGLFALPEVNAGERDRAELILSAVGETIWLSDETMMDAVTAVSGSGPAYVFYFIEAMQRAAEKLGFGEDEARRLVLATFRGASTLALQSTEAVSVLRERVTSKGGTTAAALAVLNAAGVDQAIVKAIEAAQRRGRELGEQLGAHADEKRREKPARDRTGNRR
jgi:pyrroline-5-carboxylate reductase